MMMSMFLSFTSEKASLTTRAPFFTIDEARFVSLSATFAILIARPARRWISSALRPSTSHTPLPTVPMPSRPTLIGRMALAGFISLQPELEETLHVRPLVRQHAVHYRVADRAVSARAVVA